jgi:hypothetical protein
VWKKWIPWKWFISRLARWGGFVDPVLVLGRLQRFAQPSEVMVPLELVRAGLLFHARGLLNGRAFQHNLDWVWPFWVERQFDPHDRAFVPRAFSLTHINLTHRNWTAVGLPDVDWLPLVDPHGLVTPLLDGWSLDAWIIPADGAEPLLPSRAACAEQHLILDGGVAIDTSVGRPGDVLRSRVEVVLEDGLPCCRLRVAARSEQGGQLALVVRPANPEGVSLVNDIRLTSDRTRLDIDQLGTVRFDPPPARVCMSEYRRGDVLGRLGPDGEVNAISCPVGLATAAALFPLRLGTTTEVTALIPRPTAPVLTAAPPAVPWADVLAGACVLDVPDEQYQFLYDAAVHSLILHSPGDVYPGPFTYKRFWFRDAAYILEALLALGLGDRVCRCLERYPSRQTRQGYYVSQEGEWDANGAALWIMDRYRRLTGQALGSTLVASAQRGADWICRKRLSDSLDAPHAGLMPAGFSAEHLGLNDFYFWDAFWSAAGLRCAADVHRAEGGEADARRWDAEADAALAAIDKAIGRSEPGANGCGVPASPHRRMDAGAVGNLAASYPLRLWEPGDPRLLRTVEFLMERCWVNGGFFQDMIHSGVNAYLTLHAAQMLLRAGDPRHAELTRTVSRLASPTGQWPEAIHPQTLGGCMGDGQHLWAAAEWVLMMRSIFVREEGDGLVLGSGLPPEWLTPGRRLCFGPTPTPFGPVTVKVDTDADGTTVRWDAAWRGTPPRIEVALPGHEPQTPDVAAGSLTLTRTAATTAG